MLIQRCKNVIVIVRSSVNAPFLEKFSSRNAKLTIVGGDIAISTVWVLQWRKQRIGVGKSPCLTNENTVSVHSVVHPVQAVKSHRPGFWVIMLKEELRYSDLYFFEILFMMESCCVWYKSWCRLLKCLYFFLRKGKGYHQMNSLVQGMRYYLPTTVLFDSLALS